MAVEEYFKVAKKHKISLAQLSLAFVNQQPFVTSNIIGATTMKQLKEDKESINIELSQEIIFNSPYNDTKSMLKNLETENLLTVAKLMVDSARLRKESRGSHCRFDYPEIDNSKWDKSIFWSIKEHKLQYEIRKFRQDFDDSDQVI